MARENDITTRFKVDISDLKKGITEANNEIKKSRSEFRMIQSETDDWTKSTDTLERGIRAMKDILEQETKKLKVYSNELETAKKYEAESAEKVKALKEQLKALAEQGVEKTSAQYKILSKELTDSEKAHSKLQSEVAKLTVTMNNQQASVNNAKREIDTYENGLKDVASASDNARNSSENLSEGFTVMKGALANLVADGIRLAIRELKNFAEECITVGASFDDAMAKVGAVSGATGDDLQKLRDKAKEMGATTKFTASESAEALNYMAMAGWKTEDMLDGIEGVLNLASASGSDLATTSDIVTDALTAMGYTAKDVGRLADVMASASSNANTNVEMMGQTFQYVAPLVGALGYNMEDTAVAIGLMANSGIKGEKAGTALRSIMTRLASPPTECAKAMDKLGLSLTDANGKMKPFNQVMIDMQDAFKNLDEVEQAEMASKLAGQEAMSGLLAIVNSAPADFDKLTLAVKNSAGTASKMSATMLDTVGGDFVTLKSQFEGVKIEIYEQLAPYLRKGMKEISKALKSVDWKDFAQDAGKAIEKVIDLFKWLVENRKLVVGAIGAMLGAFVGSKISGFVSSLLGTVKAFKSLKTATDVATTAQATNNAVAMANPYMAVATAIMAVVGALVAWSSTSETQVDVLKKETEEAKNQRDEILENKKAYDELTKTRNDAIASGLSEMENTKSLWKELQTLVDTNGKVKEGYEGRVGFITSELSNALGTEIKMTDSVISNYDELCNSIDKLIEKKKAEIILKSQEEAYTEAINNRLQAVSKLNELQQQVSSDEERLAQLKLNLYSSIDVGTQQYYANEISALEESLNAHREAYSEQDSIVSGYAYDIALYEKNMALAHEGRYSEMDTVTWDYISSLGEAKDSRRSILEQEINDTQFYVDYLKKLADERHTHEYDSQIKSAEQLLASKKKELSDMTSTTQSGLANINGVWSKGLSDQLSIVTGRNVEFKTAGKGLVQMYVNGVAVGQPQAETKMDLFATSIIEKVRNHESSASEAGEQLIAGVKKGIDNNDTQSSAFASISSFGSRLLANLRTTLDEHSPSKATKKMGIYLLQGLGLGIESEEDTVLKQITKFGEGVVSTLQDELGANIMIPSVNTDALKSGLKIGGVANGVGGIGGTSKVNNFTQIINAPKQPSRIELYRDTKNLIALRG